MIMGKVQQGVRTDEEAQEANPRCRALYCGLVEDIAELAHLVAEGRHDEEDEEDDSEGERDRDERRRSGGGRGEKVRRVARQDGEV